MSEEIYTPEEKITISNYDAAAEIWAREHDDPFFWLEQLLEFKKLLPSGKVLEIGSGGGRDAQVLTALDYAYTGIDASSGLVKEAQKRNPGLAFSRQSIYELNFPEAHFDGFWCSATLLHIPRQRIDEALSQIHRVVKPGGVGFISIKRGVGEENLIEDISGQTFERYFVYYSDEQFKEVLERNNYRILKNQTRIMSEKTTWLCYFIEVR